MGDYADIEIDNCIWEMINDIIPIPEDEYLEDW